VRRGTRPRVNEDQASLLRTLTRVSGALDDAGVRYALSGGCAVFARGGPETDHDVDIILRHDDVPAAVRALTAAGMRAVDPPEDWLTKVYDGDRLVDLLFRPNERPVTDETLARAEPLRVGSTQVAVQSATDILIDKLLVLGPHRGDLNEPMAVARALREQIDWDEVAAETKSSAYAEAFLVLARRMEVSPSQEAMT